MAGSSDDGELNAVLWKYPDLLDSPPQVCNFLAVASHKDNLAAFTKAFRSGIESSTKANLEMQQQEFGRAGLSQQSFWEKSKGLPYILPMMSRKADAVPSDDFLSSAEDIYNHFNDETDPTIQASLQSVALFRRDPTHVEHFLQCVNMVVSPLLGT